MSIYSFSSLDMMTFHLGSYVTIWRYLPEGSFLGNRQLWNPGNKGLQVMCQKYGLVVASLSTFVFDRNLEHAILGPWVQLGLAQLWLLQTSKDESVHDRSLFCPLTCHSLPIKRKTYKSCLRCSMHMCAYTYTNPKTKQSQMDNRQVHDDSNSLTCQVARVPKQL